MSIELEQTSAPAEFNDYARYRALSALAVVSGVLGVLSASALLDWTLCVLPVVGIITGVLALKKIWASPAEYTGELFALAGSLLSTAFLIGGISWHSYVYATEVPPDHQRINYDMLQPDPRSPGQIVPPSAAQLDGKKVFIKGYVYQPNSGGVMTGLKQFVLVRDKGQCCFGGDPKLTDMILVKLSGKLSAEFNMRVIKLAGTFHVSPTGGIHGLGPVVYQLDADHLR
ncbi:MAG TPA: DUF4190 domain-containing protein [Pirellulales bacterium]|jgi:hypothetical protein|nr:DUF4190 domain-containing protein [Pirellulales bacterium]